MSSTHELARPRVLPRRPWRPGGEWFTSFATQQSHLATCSRILLRYCPLPTMTLSLVRFFFSSCFSYNIPVSGFLNSRMKCTILLRQGSAWNCPHVHVSNCSMVNSGLDMIYSHLLQSVNRSYPLRTQTVT